MQRTATRFLCGFLLVIIHSGIAYGQGSTAQISGTVVDSTGAVLPGVEITATQTETGISRTAVSNETGAYVLTTFPLVPEPVREAALAVFDVIGGYTGELNAKPNS